MQGLMCLSVGLCSGNMAAARLLVLFFHVYIYIYIYQARMNKCIMAVTTCNFSPHLLRGVF